MIILDTNIVSEPLRARPHAGVMAWIDANQPIGLYVTSITLSESLAGMAIMQDGGKKDRKAAGFASLLQSLFYQRVLAFDEAAARAYAKIFAAMRASGRAISLFDCQIAAIAMVHGFAVATRDVQPFIDAGLDVINPWTDE